MMNRSIFWLMFLLTTPLLAQKKNNLAAPGFDMAGSDKRAVQIADEVMAAQGGRKAWDQTRHIAWTFFGVRRLHWDKWTGNVRVDNLKNDQSVVLNINTDKGRVFRNGKEETQPDSVAKFVKGAKSAWINDSYWLLMPFKLKDSGVTLKDLGEAKTEAGQPADLLQLTFKGVGDTPQNKYQVWVDKTTRLVSQWAYYPKFTDEKPGFILPWTDYKTYGNIKLSGKRGARELSDINVADALPETVYTSLDRPR
ncbi:hypothetical protein J2I47_18480 [Fibrella sp. HMF5335]|uniref:Outer membrane lipoprotein-sorting protein n=1 Tax=Fibrella rubiginis TaxID=2817060 RepID=A0A939K7E7_9BACT|nr:hypothetical protein [Fibrella rubiginis]MBO0938545.1 hypothetical protein [Fibrella rubiginis]